MMKQQEEQRLKDEMEAKEKQTKKEQPTVVSQPQKLEMFTEAGEGTIDKIISGEREEANMCQVALYIHVYTCCIYGLLHAEHYSLLIIFLYLDMKDKVFIASVRKDRMAPGMEKLGFGGIHISYPVAPTADFSANQTLQPEDDFSKWHPWLCT